MYRLLTVVCVLPGGLLPAATAAAQDASTTESVQAPAEGVVGQARAWVAEVAADVDQNESARTASAEVLNRIDLLAERMSFPAFYWVAFTLMTAGVVGFALQLTLGKLVVLSRMGLSLKKILSDALGLAISLFGLVLTTQSAADNSSFTQTPSAVLSASVVGVLAGLLHYLWGQAAEVQALVGRRQQKVSAQARVKSGK